MIAEQTVRAEIAEEWKAVLGLRDWQRSYVIPGAFINETPPESFYNLPLVLAYAALEDFLDQCIVENIFRPKKATNRLGEKMGVAKNVIPWVDFDTVDAGRDARNHLAHKGILCSRQDCLKYIKALDAELKNWGLI